MKSVFKKQLLGGMIAVAFTAGLVPVAGAAEEKVLNIYNWSDYIAPDTISNFEKETGIKVNYDNYDSNETLHAKLIIGHTGYDIVVPSTNWAELQIKGGLFQKIDKSKIPNLVHLNPAIQKLLAEVDPGNQYLVNWLWGYTTVGINVDKVKAALGDTPMPKSAWDLIFDPKYASKLKSCGISVLDSANEVLPAALHSMNLPPFSNNKADYEAAFKKIEKIRPYIKLFSSSSYIDDLANGSLCVSLGWSGDMSQSAQRAIDTKNGQKIEVLIPENGGLAFFDSMAIPKDAPHPENAYKWINYILQPKVDASLTNEVLFANPNKDSLPFVTPDVANNKSVFLSDADLAKLVIPKAVNINTRRLMTRLYTKFKTGS
ncbi:MAG: spermidine/putrescine ABC transporter substrate-binding protein PotF [Halothiobacillus sp. 14-56-357]|jgi:putrescine transport system substrate-binding protein|uniref:polyamine ABC transporter substrate-binding protein n=1 Tax=Halothiobacillus sp. 15-55-196 TaxID=1970382 RepID=UPI000BCE531A|nr:polyamine ABC transporter substrate-binding protein [Halothiobacillus sp. 15-55-196]OZB36210.1 MAG: spermidine/putrescine ABC transporter substrate-binding protein PotF [Halothiobacillus sp. 15-55-196]OZB57593.1 MAG: spermidine/putrescine ABC transporter substrate-binding protein PotF [Halothiobacillus sp. 14-56-357]OZB79166.1 MAG: spermidine/putrescine ABC transporter substrate-binding protein PotF [Halothiobacillus sp. 13-55-115]